MEKHPGMNSGCLLVAEYVDEGEIPPNEAFHAGEVVRPQVVGSYLDVWGADESINDPVMRTLLQVVQAETDGPSRARMVETIARLYALEAIREESRRGFRDDVLLAKTVDGMAKLFAPENEQLHLLFEVLRGLQDRKS